MSTPFDVPPVAVETLERESCTGFAGVPSTFAILLDKTNVAQRELPALRYLTQAGGAMAPALIQRVIDTFRGKQVFIMYGATEASARLSYLPPAELPARIGSIGRAIPNVDLRVLRDDGPECGPGETGEIVARGSNIMEGYWNDPEETAKVLDRHGYHTGDLGVADADGYLRVVGRKREMIKSGAHRISPKRSKRRSSNTSPCSRLRSSACRRVSRRDHRGPCDRASRVRAAAGGDPALLPGTPAGAQDAPSGRDPGVDAAEREREAGQEGVEGGGTPAP